MPAQLNDRPSAARPRPADGDYKVVSVRLRRAEFEMLDMEARERGLTINMALRVAIRRIGGFLETDAQTRGQLDEIVRAIGTISDEIWRISDACERGGGTDLDALAAQRVAFGGEFMKLDALLRNILNTSRRRADGRILLKSAGAH